MKRVCCFLIVAVLIMSMAPMAVRAEEAKRISIVPMSLQPGEKKQLVVIGDEPQDLTLRLTVKSSNKKVATIAAGGVVTAKRPGKTTLSVYANGKKKASYQLRVAYVNDGTKYFFYGIGNGAYPKPDDTPPSFKSAAKMNTLFGKASFAGSTVSRQVAYDLTGRQIYDFLNSISLNPNITENDVTYFYYAGHGGEVKDSFMRGALCGIDGTAVSVDWVQEALDKVPGRIVVILDCCLSGQFIESKSGISNGETISAEQFGSSVIKAFAGSRAKNYAQAKALTGPGSYAKYRIITSCQPLEYSHYFWRKKKSDGFSLFSKYALAGMNGSADSNKDKRVSLDELYRYTNKKVSAYMKKWNRANKRNKFTQHVMVWPANDASYIFAKD